MLSETCGRLSDAFRIRHPEIDWVGIRGFRNAVVHEYDELNLRVVIDVLRNRLPMLKVLLLSEIERLGSSNMEG